MSGQVLRRKIRVVRQAAKGTASPVDRAWRVGLARALRDMAHVTAEVTSLTISRRSLAEVLELPPDRALILTLDGPEAGMGLVLLAHDVMSAIVETMTLGRCAPSAAEPRKPTRTDAAMVAPIIEQSLRNLEEALEDAPELAWTSDFFYSSCLEDARPLSLLLEDVPYRVIEGTVSISDGAREGSVIVVLPAEGKGRKPASFDHAIPAELQATYFTARVAAKVEQSEVRIDAVLGRLSLPIADAMALRVGMQLELPTAALDRISLEGLDGRNLATAKLGQHRGMRALRLTSLPQTEGLTEPMHQAPMPGISNIAETDHYDEQVNFPLAATGS